MKRPSSLVVISFGLMCLTLTVMFAANLLVDLVPDPSAEELEYRRGFSEALAVQLTKHAEQGDTITIKLALSRSVEQNDDVLSAALLTTDGVMLAKAGDHEGEWVQPPGELSTFNHIQVPIFSGDAPWGILQITFRQPLGGGLWGLLTNPWIQFIAFLAALGFLGYWLFMKKTLRQLDPSDVVPWRVKAALDVLAEGVVLLDTSGYIVLANAAFAARLGRKSAELLGHELSELPWQLPYWAAAQVTYPWNQAMQACEPQFGVRLWLAPVPKGEATNFLVNSAPIVDEGGTVRGVLTSFSDVTELDQTNAHLTAVVNELEASRAEVMHQNTELGRLATRDPLSGLLNRRAFFAKVETAFASARLEGTPLSCVLVDIDHFKSLNRRHGRAVGDQVIMAVARTLTAALRPTDLLGRHAGGGVDFSIVLPGEGVELAAKVAEHIRERIEAACGAWIRSIAGIQITVSLGVSSTAFGAADPLQLIDQADEALYAAKDNGRNGVMCWGQIGQAQVP